jgi:hypothetical protein
MLLLLVDGVAVDGMWKNQNQNQQNKYNLKL